MGAPLGNRNGAKTHFEWRDALRKALAEYEDDDVKRGQALRRIGRKIVKKALAGEYRAIQEIGDRLDGRPAQAVSVGIETTDSQGQIDTLDTARRILWLLSEAERAREEDSQIVAVQDGSGGEISSDPIPGHTLGSRH